MAIEKDITKNDDYKFLGKEIEYDKLIFKYLSAIEEKSAVGLDVTNLVNMLESTFTYKDKDYTDNIKKAREELDKKLKAAKDGKFGKTDPQKQRQAVVEFTQTKYNELCKLMKRKKKFPQEAEEEIYD